MVSRSLSRIYTRSYLSWRILLSRPRKNNHSPWNLFNLTAVIESTPVLEYTRSTRRLIGFIVEIHREASRHAQRVLALVRPRSFARSLALLSVSRSRKKNRRSVICASNLAASFRFRSLPVTNRPRTGERDTARGYTFGLHTATVWRANAIRIFTLSEAVRRLIAPSAARGNKGSH